MKTFVLIIATGVLSLLAPYHQGSCAATTPPSPVIPGFIEIRMTPAQINLLDAQGDLDQQAQKALDANDLRNAESIAREGASLNSLQGDDILAEVLYLEGKYQESLQEYKKIVEDEKGSQPQWLMPYALLELKAGNWVKAVSAFDTLQRVYGDGRDLLDKYRHFTVENPQPEDMATLIHIEMARGDASDTNVNPVFTARAMNEYHKALAIEPNSPLAQLYYAHWLLDNKRLPEAKALFKTLSATAQGDIKADADDALKTKLWNVKDAPAAQGSGQN